MARFDFAPVWIDAEHNPVWMDDAERDLGSAELWQGSLQRSRTRRALAVQGRKEVARRKRASLAASAALLAGHSGGLFAGLRVPESASAHVAAARFSVGAALRGQLALVSYGDTGEIVVAAQRELGVTPDGIFGPRTLAAVRVFQERHGLLPTGVVDARTWAALFEARVSVLRAVSASGGPSEASEGSAGASSALARAVEVPAAQAAAEAIPHTPRPLEPSLETMSGRATEPQTEGSARLDSGDAGTPTTRSDRGLDTGRRGGGSEGDTVAVELELDARAKEPTMVPAVDPTPQVAVCGEGVVPPVRGVVSGRYGEARPGHAHAGIDISAPSGTPVRSAGCGTVAQSGVQGGYGNLVCVDHGDGVTTCYAHLSRSVAVVGTPVHAGDTVGYVGCTGRCSGPHLHFEVRVNGTPRDPSRYLAGAERLPVGHADGAPRVRAAAAEHTVGRDVSASVPEGARAPAGDPTVGPSTTASPTRPASAPPSDEAAVPGAPADSSLALQVAAAAPTEAAPTPTAVETSPPAMTAVTGAAEASGPAVVEPAAPTAPAPPEDLVSVAPSSGPPATPGSDAESAPATAPPVEAVSTPASGEATAPAAATVGGGAAAASETPVEPAPGVPAAGPQPEVTVAQAGPAAPPSAPAPDASAQASTPPPPAPSPPTQTPEAGGLSGADPATPPSSASSGSGEPVTAATAEAGTDAAGAA